MAATVWTTSLLPPYRASEEDVKLRDEQELNQNDRPPQYTLGAETYPVTPDYDCSVELEARALLKVEFTRPFAFSNYRSWRPIQCKIHGTILRLSTMDRARSLSLQAADAGLAPDYRKRANVIRVRAEGYQFLLALPSMTACLEWLEKLHAAIAISSPLENWTERSTWFSTVPKTRPPMSSTLSQYMRKQWRERPAHPSQVWLRAECGQNGGTAVIQHGGGYCHCQKDLNGSLSDSSDPAAATDDDHIVENKAKRGEAKPKDEHTVSCVHSETEFAERCARWLLRSAKWRYGWYYSDGERVGVLSWACLPGRHAILCPCSHCRSM